MKPCLFQCWRRPQWRLHRHRSRAASVCFSAGVGRSGAFIAIDHVLRLLNRYPGVNIGIDIFGLVAEMRMYRIQMVQNEVVP